MSAEAATRVVHVRRAPHDVYIGRALPPLGFQASVWANPFKIRPGCNREQVLEKYETYLHGSPALLARLPELRGKVLGCWCAPEGGLAVDDPLICHGQVLARLTEELL